ncbi:MAG: DUF4054 domain-containing protein [Xanthobacteraceae bacterium]
MAIEKPNAADVKAIISTTLSDEVVGALIDDAALLAENCIASLDGDRQKAILKWLTAHLIASTNSNASKTSSKLGDAQDTFARAQLGEGLKGTIYGQQALALDPNGCLIGIGKVKAFMENL